MNNWHCGYGLPELLALSLQQPALPAHIYRYILDFLASNPSPEQIADFRPPAQMQERQFIYLTMRDLPSPAAMTTT